MDMNGIEKTDVRIEVQVAGMPLKCIYVNALPMTKKNSKDWLKGNGDYFFERYGFQPAGPQRVAFVCSDAACAYAAGNKSAFKQAAPVIGVAARIVGLLDRGKLVVQIIKADPFSNVVKTEFHHVSHEQYLAEAQI
jgi:hypothetical protein